MSDNTAEIALQRGMLQATMTFMGALAYGLEQVVGRGSNSVSFLAGKKLGRQFTEGVPQTTDVGAALDQVNRILRANGCLWEFGLFEPQGKARELVDGGSDTVDTLIVFKDCMIRQSLFRFGHVQKGSLCSLTHGFISGAIEGVMGLSSELEILHAGENACLKRLRIKKETPQ